jgi:large subunit ribosomal protein L29
VVEKSSLLFGVEIMSKKLVKDLREKNIEALNIELEETRRQLFTLKSQAVTQKLDNPHQITKTRHQIARILSVLGEKTKEAAKA